MKTSIHALHHQTNDWLRELEFYKQELPILESRLGEVVAKNTDKDLLAQAEHFQNRFILLKEQHDQLARDNRVRLQEIEVLAGNLPEHIDEKFVAANDEMHKRMRDYSSSMHDTRFEFNRFLSRVM